jgi:hypothetical protein
MMQIYGVELEIWLGLLAAVGALTVWGLKKYQTMMADGKITLSEVIDAIDGGEELVEEVIEEAQKVEEAKKAADKKE